jgi:hypothetical protein
MRRIVLGLALVGAASLALAAPRATPAQIPGEPWCTLTTYAPYTNAGLVGGRGTLSCSWPALWDLTVCLQLYSRLDLAWSNVTCRRDWDDVDHRRSSTYLVPLDYCKYYGINLFRTWARATWFRDYWRTTTSISDHTYNCFG